MIILFINLPKQLKTRGLRIDLFTGVRSCVKALLIEVVPRELGTILNLRSYAGHGYSKD
jgi:hypothetical protein